MVSREAVQHALSDHAASTKALLDADFTVFDTGELLGLVFVNHEEAAPGPRGVFLGNGETLLLELSSYLLKQGLFLGVSIGH